MTQLAQEIAVLDGLDDLYGSSIDIDPTDGRIGQKTATGTEYATKVMPGVTARRNVIDASEGANYSGGSSFAPGLPLMPSTVGLADPELLAYSNQQGVLPARRNVIDPSGGANYTGGADWTGGLPLTVSSAGLAELADLQAASEALDPTDGRIGQRPAYGTEYSKWLMPGVTTRRNVIDASEGANYSGGSSYAPGLPLMPSTVGLADAQIDDELDGLSDAELGLGRLGSRYRRAVGRDRLRRLKKKYRKAMKAMHKASPAQAVRAAEMNARVANKIKRARAVRRAIWARRMNPVTRFPSLPRPTMTYGA